MINIGVDDRQLRAAMRDAKEQIPFAIAVGLTRFAFEARDELRKHVRDDGIMQRRTWVVSGIRVLKKATKADQVAQVGSMDGIMAAAAVGEKRQFAGLVPVLGGPARPTREQVIPRNARRNANVLARLLEQRDRATNAKQYVRIRDTVYGRRGRPVMRQRAAPEGERNTRKIRSGPLVAVFRVPAGNVYISRVWKLDERLAKVQARRMSAIMAEAVDFALRTRR